MTICLYVISINVANTFMVDFIHDKDTLFSARNSKVRIFDSVDVYACWSLISHDSSAFHSYQKMNWSEAIRKIKSCYKLNCFHCYACESVTIR